MSNTTTENAAACPVAPPLDVRHPMSNTTTENAAACPVAPPKADGIGEPRR